MEKKNDSLEVGRRKKKCLTGADFSGEIVFLSVLCYLDGRVLAHTFYRAFLTNFREKNRPTQKSVTFMDRKVLVFEVRNFK